MRHIAPYSLWLGHVGDVREFRRVLSQGIRAVVDLALDEPPAALTRDLVYCRFPLVDGAGNPAWTLRAAVETTAHLLRSRVPTLVYCGAGMSRSPAIAAAALATITPGSLDERLALVLKGGSGDVSPAFWRELHAVLSRADNGPRKTDYGPAE